MHIGWKCAFSLEESCHNVLGKSWFFFLVYCLGKITIFVLILVNFLQTGIFHAFCRLLFLGFFFKISFFEKLFQECHQCVK